MKTRLRKLILCCLNKENWNITEFAAYIDASEKSVYKWENGTSAPDAKHLLAMIDYLEER
jgi:DNA-binding transcriptional regulator YiaG